MAKYRMAVSTTQLTSAGRKSRKNCASCNLFCCHTISVVMLPKGEKAPPALAATTMDTQPMATNFGAFRPMDSTTAPMTSAVVRVSSNPAKPLAHVGGVLKYHQHIGHHKNHQ